MKLSYKIFFFLFAIAFFGCSKEKFKHTKKVKIQSTGKRVDGGCGLFFVINQVGYMADNDSILDDKYYNAEETEVKLKFRYLDDRLERVCGDIESKYEMKGIHIIEVK